MKKSRRAAKKGPDSHFIPRVVLRNWKWSDGRLRYLNLAAGHGRVQRSFPDSYGVSAEPFPAGVETALGRVIETPIGEYLARAKRGGDPAFTPAEQKAMAVWLLSQGAITYAGTTGEHGPLTKLLLMNEGELVTRSFFKFGALIQVRSTKPLLFLPSTGMAPLPLVRDHDVTYDDQPSPLGDESFGWLLPVTPTMAIAHMPNHGKFIKPSFWDEWLVRLSIGMVGDRVLLPPEEEHTLAVLAARREEVREFCKVVHDHNVADLERVRGKQKD